MRVIYDDIHVRYEEVKESACGRKACSVMILVASEVDAMASARMLTQMLRADNIAYNLRPVSTYAQIEAVKSSLISSDSDIKTVFMINCGATWDLPNLFDVEFGGDLQIFVMDNHRPIHLKNIQQKDNVAVFVEEFELYDGAPEDFEEDDLVTDDDESGEEEGDDDGDDAESEDEDDDDLDIPEEADAEEEFMAGSDNEEEGEGGDKEGEEEEGGDNKVDEEKEGEEGEGAADADADADAENKQPDAATDTFGLDMEPAADTDANEGDTSHEVDEVADPEYDEDEEEEGDVRVNKKRKLSKDVNAERKERVAIYKNTRSSYSKPTSWMLLALASGRGNLLDTIWQAILGVTDQHERQRLNEEQYYDICNDLHLQLANYLSTKGDRKYTVGEGEMSVVVPGAQTGHIEEGQDYRFFLYRHWSLFDAMCFSPYVSAKMKTWKSQGTYKLQELLAKMGVSLEECKQMYSFMAPESKQHFAEKINAAEIKENYFLADPDVTCRSFYRFNSFKNPVGARDVIHAAAALVENYGTYHEMDADKEGSRLKAFNEAYDCLGMHAEPMLKKGLQAAINLQKMIVKTAGAVLEDDLQILKLKYLYHIQIMPSNARDNNKSAKANNAAGEEEEIDPPFSRPMVLLKLGQYIMDVKMNMDKRREQGWKGKKLLPLILAGEEQRNGKCLVVGIDPRPSVLSNQAKEDCDLEVLDNLCNFKGMFKAASKGLGVVYPSSGATFDANIVEMPTEFVHDFVYNLSIWLRGAARANA